MRCRSYIGSFSTETSLDKLYCAMTLRPDEHVCTLLDTPELLDPNDSQVQDGQVFKKQRQADTIINSMPHPNPQGKHSILWIGRVPFVKDELNDLVYSGKSCMKVCKSEIYRPQVTCYSCMEQESIDCPCRILREYYCLKYK